MKRERKLKNNFIWIQIYYFFRSFIFAYVIERLFWRSRGISISDTVFIEIIYAVVLVIMEVPTGVWADRWSRKKMISMGAFLTVMGSIGMVFARGFLPFVIIIGMSGISGALTSGSVSALLYDGLKEMNASFAFEKYLARIKAIRYGSGLFAALIGAYLASQYNLLLPYQLSVISCLIMFIMTLFLVEPRRNKEEEHEVLSAKAILTISKKAVFNSPFLKYIFIVGAMIGAGITYIEEFWQNYVDAISVDIIYFGLISGAMSLVVIFGAAATGKISSFIQNRFELKKKLYRSLMLLTGLCLIGLYFIRHPLGILFMLLVLFIEAIIDSIVLADIHQQAASEYRATIESIYAMFSNLMAMGVGLVFAYTSQRYTIFSGFMMIGTLIVLVLIFEVILLKYKHEELL